MIFIKHWVTKDGGFCRISDMGDSHLDNAFKRIYRALGGDIIKLISLGYERARRSFKGIKVEKTLYLKDPLSVRGVFDPQMDEFH